MSQTISVQDRVARVFLVVMLVGLSPFLIAAGIVLAYMFFTWGYINAPTNIQWQQKGEKKVWVHVHQVHKAKFSDYGIVLIKPFQQEEV